ncbi:MAG: S1 RNA-binding domain-containing protein [Butyrivibrio sp.]|uniref:CvfB family protein n=1 Tax=Butyrivibrio sp. NC2002 TaxID=1410610 RepID=UPI00055D872E|nr:S1-like domain-containing RNA-binding protein [Butyrivibrio sp. NC2002]MBE5858589.1 S1 RNA-binding domain-containing protein [Butyrivibrio sp.]
MLKIGEKQELIIIKKVDFGVYLAEREGEEDKVLLPKKQVPEGAELGDKLSVFLYKDSDDRLIATTRTPKIMLGQVNVLRVTDVGKIGAFMDWGLEKDVLLPFREQTRKVKKGENILCALYVDKSGRLAVTMNVYEFLRTDSPYHKEDRVQGTVYESSDNFGMFVAVDDIFSALIPKKELYGDVRIGDTVTARIVEVKEDGKLTLSLREKAYLQINTDAEKIEDIMKEKGGRLPFTDKASPELIRNEMHMSKNEFKRAVGHLLKEGKIEILENEIKLK